jgi:hypothetical protein
VYSKIAGKVAFESLQQVAMAGVGGAAMKGGAWFAAKVGKSAVGQMAGKLATTLVSEAKLEAAACAGKTVVKVGGATLNAGALVLQSWQVGKYSKAALAAYEKGDTAGVVEQLAKAGLNGLGLASSVKQLAADIKCVLKEGWKYFAACFAEATPIWTPHGAKTIEHLRPGDLVWARDEFDPSGPLMAKVVEAVFVRQGLVLELRVGGRLIRTAGEHPFYRHHEGWVGANRLRAGDLLLGDAGQWLTVDEVTETDELATLYNVRVADYHTYFVGDDDWGFGVWAHNVCKVSDVKEALHGSGVSEAEAQRLADLANAGKEKDLLTELKNLNPKATEAELKEVANALSAKALGNAPTKIPAGAPGSAEHKAAAWKAYQERGGEWNYERWGNVYEQNMVRARAANKVVDDYHATLGWGKREVTVDAGGQARRLDIADVATRKGVEVKSGYTTLNEEIRSEIARDAILKGQGWDIRWHFEGTASKPLLEALEKAGIPYTGGK